ncbi:NAD(P)H-dependent oxidoreductase [bacterium]|nr:NAD(P)H-dependent oxidoreductase [bacterium]
MVNNLTSQVDIVNHLKWRYATKKFDNSKKIDQETWTQLEESLVLTPSSYGLQPWKFVVVTDPEVKAQLGEKSFVQPQPLDCSHLVVISRLTTMDHDYVEKYLQSIAEARSTTLESLEAYKGMLTGFVERTSQTDLEHWMARQCYIALGNLLTAAAVLRVDACPMEGFDKNGYDEVLNLSPRGLASVVLCALGYRDSSDKYASQEKVRHPVSDVVIHI